MARSFSPNAGVEDRTAVDEIFAQSLDRLQRRAGAEDHDRQDRRLQGVEHQRVDVQFADVAENLVVERLPMGDRVDGDADQRREPEHHVAEMDERDVRDQIGLERAIEIEKDEDDDDGNNADPELLLPGSVFRHVHVLVLSS